MMITDHLYPMARCRGKNEANLHPVHVRSLAWPDWLNEGVALLEKNIQDLKHKQVKEQEKKAAAAAEAATAAVAAAAVVVKEQQARSSETSAEQKSGRSGSGRSAANALTDQQKKDMTSVVQQRKEYESKHRELRAEREKTQKELVREHCVGGACGWYSWCNFQCRFNYTKAGLDHFGRRSNPSCIF